EFINGISGTKNISDYLKRRTQGIARHDLDKQFIRDLKKWYGYLQELKWTEDPKNNSVLLLNKLIFALTLEDFIIIDYRYVWETFVSAYKRWKTKGSMKVLEAFFHDLDEFLYEYYDTELFIPSSNILSRLEQSKENYDRALDVLKRVAGFDEQAKIFSEGLYSYSFRVIDEDVFGKSYETFLAEDRKDQGIYYTPREITRHMSSAIVKEIFRPLADEIVSNINGGHFDVARDRVNRFLSCGVIDPSCGSGPFLIGVLREIYHIYQDLDNETIWVERQFGQHSSLLLPPDVAHKIEETGKIRNMLGLRSDGIQRDLISKIILRHIFGADLDRTALNVAKVNLWKEAVKLNAKSFYYQELPENENHILPDLELNFINGNSIISLPDEQIINIMYSEFKVDIQEMMALYRRYRENPTESEIPGSITNIKRKIRARLDVEFRKTYSLLKGALYFPLEYFFFYFDESGSPLDKENSGFAGVIGNPPWNNLKPNKKEFAAKHPEIFGEGISKYSITGKEFEKLFAEKMSDPIVKAEWDSYVSYFKELSSFISNNYKLQYGGDFSLQKVFTERFLELGKRAFGILIPSNFHTDKGTYLIRKEVIEKWEIRELISFENRGKVWFPDIHAQFKFDMLLVSKDKTGRSFKAKFYVTDWKQIDEMFDYPAQLVGKMSPDVMGITEFRSSADIPLVSKIRGNYRLLKDTGLVLRSELHETNDKDIFSEEQKGLILYEGKMIHQYNSHFSQNKYWVDEELGRQRLFGRTVDRIMEKIMNKGYKIDKKMIEKGIKNGTIKMDYKNERLVFRDVAGATNERTIISCVLQSGAFLANTLPYIEPFNVEIGHEGIIEQKPIGDYIYYIQALFNSFVLDYYIRQRVTSHLNFFFVYELPIPDIPEVLLKEIIAKSRELSNNNDLMLRAELEAQIAGKIFDLTIDEMKIILDSFIYGNIDESLKDEILKRMKTNEA
ncbi:MAG: Eco57I restriction-modification methylase domain-containing protein, partial [Thermoplasmata archaeon]